ncbi:RnfH family protein [Hydrogenophaga sp.]|uniref:RnfH family protein n=1 Tax=Hydrogenophaga sp. TaxID=1904254 RepID=UPI002718F4E0|nr:RnfH family protein [Hydrogenophaga sp.]MDO8904514.1 RnfH family protein [Hydrogenophaga sp.]
MKVDLLYSPSPRQVLEATLQLPSCATLGDAMLKSGWMDAHPEIGSAAMTFGIWGRRASPSTPLREGDRVEVYRALRVDPKVARRERFVGQGARSAGLFAQRRPGSKAGY